MPKPPLGPLPCRRLQLVIGRALPTVRAGSADARDILVISTVSTLLLWDKSSPTDSSSIPMGTSDVITSAVWGFDLCQLRGRRGVVCMVTNLSPLVLLKLDPALSYKQLASK